MKKALKITGIVLAVLIIAIAVTPFLFQKQIVQKVKDEINKNVNAKVEFSDYGLSLFRSFPDFSLRLDDLTIAGVQEFEGDTLANIKSLYVTIDLMSVFKGELYEIKAVNLSSPKLLLKVLKDGKANWDISKPAPVDTTTAKAEEPSTFKAALDKVALTDADIIYDDASLDTYVHVKNMSTTLKGDLTSDFTSLAIDGALGEIDMSYGGVKYLNKAKLELNADIDADMKLYKFTFKDNEIKLNDLAFGLDGFFTMLDEGYDMDLKLKAEKNSFKNFLSLVPGMYSKDFEKVETSGTLALDAFVKGKYTEKLFPAFSLKIMIDNAMFKYPDLPKAVTNIAVNTTISNDGKGMDNTIINIAKFHVEMANNPLDMTMNVTTPVSDPNINGMIKGKLNLADVKMFYPLEEGQQLNGLFNMDVTLKGRMSSIEKKQYEDFKASGNLAISNFSYKSKDYPKGVTITSAGLTFAPQFMELTSFYLTMGKNDISAKGKVENYMAYMFRNEKLKGNFVTSSRYFNLNDLMEEPAQPAAASTSDTAASTLSVIRVPENIDFTLTSTFGKVVYDNFDMTNMKGVIIIKDEQVTLQNLMMNMMDGQLTANGSYNTRNPKKPMVDFALDISQFDIQKTAKTFNTVKKLAPIAEKAKGKFSTKMSLKTALDGKMSPVLNSMSGDGALMTTKVYVEQFEPLKKLSEALKINKLSKIMMEKVNLSFNFVDGKVYVKPFDFMVDKIKVNASGSNSLDQSINYLLNMEIPKSEFGGQANAVLNSLVSDASKKGVNAKVSDVVKVDVIIGGTITNPTIKTGLKGAMDNAVEDLKNKANEELNKKKDELENKAKEEADKLKQEAEQKVKDATDKAKTEAERLKKEAEAKAKAEAEKKKKEAEEKAKEEAKKKLKGLL